MPLDTALLAAPPRLKPNEKIACLGKPARVWVVGALYGRYGALCSMHEALSARLRPHTHIVYLGNYPGAYSQWTGEGKALIGELMAFRNAVISIAGFFVEDVAFLRGPLEDLALKLTRLPFLKNPATWARTAVENGLEAYLDAYGLPATDLLALTKEGPVAANRFAHQWRKQIATRKGHDAFFNSLSHAAHTGTNAPVAFVPEGLDPDLPLHLQGETLCWPELDITTLRRYQNYVRVVRAVGPPTLPDNKDFVLTLDGHNGLDGMIYAVCLDPEGQIIETLSFDMARLLAHRFKRERLAQQQWLPEDMYDWLAERTAQAAGLVLLMLALASWLALITYNSADPSFNTASNVGLEAVHNWLGLWGSYAADLLHQGFGLGSYLLVIVLAAWAWRVATARGLSPFLLRCLTAFATLIFAAVGLQSLLYGFGGDVSPFSMPAGGLLGQLTYAFLHHYELGKGLAVAVGLSGAALAIGFLYLCCGLSLEEWQRVLHYLQRLMEHAGRFAVWTGKSAWAWVMKEDVEEAPRMATEAERMPVEEEMEENVGPTLVRKKKKRQVIRKPKPAVQPQLDFVGNEAGDVLPPLHLLQMPDAPQKTDESISEEALEKNARMLESVLGDFGVQGRITQVSPGPVITLYELEPAPGIKSSRVISLADDVARSMSATSVRIAVVPGKNVIGIELPNRSRETVYLRELLMVDAHRDISAKLPLAMGKDIGGVPVVTDLARMPHLLVAGTTGSGKSVAINTMILSLLYRHSPRECRFIMIDPKMLELSVYEGIPHLLAPVVTEPRKAIFALKWTVREMEERYRSMSKLGVRNIEGYNMRVKEARDAGKTLLRKVQTGFDPDTGKPIFEDQPLDLTDLPYIVVIVDEMADLMLVAGKEIEAAIQRLAQMARAAGIHIIMATQRPSVDVITGTIKANFPSRVSFQVTSKIDSRTILGEQGAEQLLGQGDMLYMAGGGRVTRVHGPFVSDAEVQGVVNFLKEQGEPEYLEEVTEEESEGEGGEGTFGQGNSSGDDLYDKAVDIVLRERKASTSFIQRHLQIGYNRAARIMEQMEKDGIVGAPNHVGKREILGRSMED